MANNPYTVNDALQMLNGLIPVPEGMFLPNNTNIDAIYIAGEALEYVRSLAPSAAERTRHGEHMSQKMTVPLAIRQAKKQRDDPYENSLYG
ncbi:MAG: hypothetical protein AAGJ68_10610 [Pseudomonadota bacterium]